MSKITTEQVKKLRDSTGISIGEVKRALEEALGDAGKAAEILKKRGAAIAKKKSYRVLGSGYITSYLHGDGKIVAMVEVHCETDFVAKNEVMRALAKEIAMQVAATDPEDISRLLEEPWVKNPEQSVRELLEGAIQKTGERIEVGNFTRFEV